MNLLNFKKDNKILLGIKTERGVIDVGQAAEKSRIEAPADMMQVILQGKDALLKLAEIEKSAVQVIEEEKIEFAPCLINPEKILCVGLNYRKHVEETQYDRSEFPVIFSMFNNALAGHKQKIKLPKASKKYDYEAELVVVIGKEAFCVKEEEALSYVFGYTAGNDLSARDLQVRTSQWLIGKTCDGFAPIGPYITTADEVDPNNLNIQSEVNGKLRQSANTAEMIFDCAAIVSYISQFMTLKPGDIIFTGTPSGVIIGEPKGQRVWLKAGDEITVTIENIGALTNTLG